MIRSETREHFWDHVRNDFLDVYLAMSHLEKVLHQRLEDAEPQLDYSLAASHINVLVILSRRKHLNMTQLAGEMRCSRQQMTRVVDFLVGKELLLRYEHSQNRRFVMLTLSPQGRKLVRALDHWLQDHFFADSGPGPEFAQAISTIRNSLTAPLAAATNNMAIKGGK